MAGYDLDPFGFRDIERRQSEWREEAKRSLMPGSDPADLRPGMVITISPNLQTGDRSGVTDLHEVMSINTGHVQARALDGYWAGKPPRLWLAHEHHFYIADGFSKPSGDE